MNGTEMMLKAMGVDPKQIMQDFNNLKDGVIKTLETVDARMTRIENALKFQMGEDAWKQAQNQPHQPTPVQPPAAQKQPQLVPSSPSTLQK